MDWLGWIVVSFEFDLLFFFEGVERIAVNPGWFNLRNGSYDWFGGEISKLLCYFVFWVVIVLVSIGTCKHEFLCVIDALLMVPCFSAGLIIRTISLYLEFYLALFYRFNLADYEGEILDTLFVLSLNDEHKALNCFFPTLQLYFTDLS